jgi:hypothetical protein
MLILSKGMIPVFALAQGANKKARRLFCTEPIAGSRLSFDQFVGNTD